MNIVTAFRKLSRNTITATGLLLVAAVGFLDYASGYEFSFSLFYLLPIVIVTWRVGKGTGYVIAIMCTLVWQLADIASGRILKHVFAPYWNALMRIGFDIVVIELLCQLKIYYDEQLKVLRGLIPICAWCKRIRNDQGYWQQVEAYVAENTEATFTHGICQECREKEFSNKENLGPDT